MPSAKPLRPTPAQTEPGCGGGERTPQGQRLSANAQAWRRLAREGYGRTAEQVRASQPAPLQRELDSPSQR